MAIQRVKPGPGQESVWDYPRPPALEHCTRCIRVVAGGLTLVDTTDAMRVLETSHPPVYYAPPTEVLARHLTPSVRRSFCEWKGEARYFDLRIGDQTIADVAWAYPAPTAAFAAIRDYLAFYPHKVDACYVDQELAQPQAGGFYGGWITSHMVGPFKGEPGTMGW